MITATYNSLTFLPVKGFKKLFKFIYQNQDRSIEQQYADGIRIYDFRVAFRKNKPIIKHGIVTFKGDMFYYLNYLNQYKDTYIRIWLEEDKNYSKFINFCKYIENTYKNIKFFGGQSKYNQTKQLYDFHNVIPPIIECYQSRYKLGWYPYLYAKKNNAQNKKKYKDQNLMLDFYEI